VPRLQRKGFGGPDEVRRFPNGVVEIVTLDEINVSRFVFQPGWRWLTDVGPIAGTDSCQHRHVGYTISGRLAVRMNDGTALSIGPGDAYEIPPGHVAWVDGDVRGSP
jgi:mannose-6-phosphate isomerase-like protein (cupin superfamily)